MISDEIHSILGHLNKKRVLLVGLGRNGGGAGIVRYLLRKGANIRVTDQKDASFLEPSLVELRKESGFSEIGFRFGEKSRADVDWCDVVIKTPGVPYTSDLIVYAENQSIPILSEADIFFPELERMFETRPTVVGVTGTRGKSTTSTLIYEYLRREYDHVYLAGNIGRSMVDVLPFLTAESYVVLELSSFQLETFRYRPDIGVITNLYPDHLNRHETMENYAHAKQQLIEHQTSSDYAVLSADHSAVSEMARMTKARVRWVSTSSTASPRESWIEGEYIYTRSFERPICKTEEVALPGEHNLWNVLAALSVVSLLGVSSETMRDVLRNFQGVPHRLEKVRTVKGVTFVNDTASTMPEATLAALQAFQNTPLHLIAGGGTKDVSYTELAQGFDVFPIQTLILMPGDASAELQKQLSEKRKFPVHVVDSLEQAVNKAFERAQDGDLVLFSPGATSFVSFANEFERGEVFRRLVHSLSV